MPTTKKLAKRVTKPAAGDDRKFDAIRDTLDFRDLMYVPTLIEVPQAWPLSKYRATKIPVLNQGSEGACTGFGLATVIHYLLKSRDKKAVRLDVSPYMLYQFARRYDEWPGSNYSGSSARGAMKAWQKHGVCERQYCPSSDYKLRADGWKDAARRPLGAYFRVNHKDLVAMHAAISEVNILFATAVVHEGWDYVGSNGLIEKAEGGTSAHAFAIVGYDERGFWVQNSWGPTWGKQGFAQITYDDWLENGLDVWVARLGAPVILSAGGNSTAVGMRPSSKGTRSYVFPDLRPHVISTGNDGALRLGGTYGNDAADVADIFDRLFVERTADWKKRKLVLYAHGGLTGEDSALQRVAEYVDPCSQAHAYPIAFIWKTDFWTTVTNIMKDAIRRNRPEGIVDGMKDFMLDRLDDTLEPLARALGGKTAWSEMKENAVLASMKPNGGAAIAARHVAQLAANDPKFELHLVAHSAGSNYFGPLVQLLTGDPSTEVFPGMPGLGVTIDSVTLWAPAITTDQFKETYLPALQNGMIRRMTVFTLNDSAEQDDHCASIYHKSLLYLVANAFEERARSPMSRELGTQITGLARSITADPVLRRVFVPSGTRPNRPHVEWIVSPDPAGSSGATSHGGFDNDSATVIATLKRITSAAATTGTKFTHSTSASSMADRRKVINNVR